LKKDDTQALLSLAVAHRSKGELDLAMKGYDKVLEVDERNSSAHFNIAVMNHEIYASETEDPDKAIGYYRKAIEHYREFLSLDSAEDGALRKNADKRISNCVQLIDTQEQLKQMLKEQDAMEQQQPESPPSEEAPPEG
jgi:tetratricopeptide (TPR) repeat protein